jgi:hypothetical protein
VELVIQKFANKGYEVWPTKLDTDRMSCLLSLLNPILTDEGSVKEVYVTYQKFFPTRYMQECVVQDHLHLRHLHSPCWRDFAVSELLEPHHSDELHKYKTLN